MNAARAYRTLISVAIVLSLALWTSACGDDEEEKEAAAPATQTATQPEPPAQLDVAKLESLIRKTLSRTSPGIPGVNQEQTKSETKVTSVRCPNEVEQKKGGKFRCELKAVTEIGGGTIQQSGSITLTQEDAKGGVLGYKARLRSEGIKTTQTGKLKLD